MKNLFFIKRSVAYALAALVAIWASYYLHLPEKYWAPLVAVLVMQTTIGLALRQGIQRYLSILVAVSIASLVVFVAKQPWLLIMTIIAFGVGSFYITAAINKNQTYPFIFLFICIFLLTLLLPVAYSSTFYERFYAMTLGAVIGIIVNLLVFPVHVDVVFRQNMISVLKDYGDDLQLVMQLLLSSGENKRLLLEKSLQTKMTKLPVWVYQSGLSVVFRSGHRHFLMIIEQIGQLLFSMHHLARYDYDQLLLQGLHDSLMTITQQIEKTMQAIITVLNLNKLTEGISDLSNEIAALERSFHKTVPLSLELMDISKEYVFLAAFVQDLKDLRMSFMQLSLALRERELGNK